MFIASSKNALFYHPVKKKKDVLLELAYVWKGQKQGRPLSLEPTPGEGRGICALCDITKGWLPELSQLTKTFVLEHFKR